MSDLNDLYELARQHHQTGNLSGAEELYRQVLLSDPNHQDANTKLGMVLYAQGNFGEATTAFRQAQRLKPRDASTHYNVALALHRSGRIADAVMAYQEALTLQADLFVVWNNMGCAFRAIGKRDDAVGCFHNALKIKPDYAEAYSNLANVLAEQNQLDNAVLCFEWALRLRSDDADTHYNFGLALEKCGRLEDAAAALRKAVQLNPEVVAAQFSLAVVLQELGELDEALAAYNHALRLAPFHAKARQNRALIWLQRGDWELGWPEYEYRWQTENFPRHFFAKPRWDGSSLEGRKLLLVAEQGLGDTLQFVRLVPVLQQGGGKIIMMCQPPLQRLLCDALGPENVLVLGSKLPEFDLYAPLLSVPGLLGMRPATVVANVPYLSAAADLVEQWRKSLADLRGRKIGIAWQGNPTIGDHRRCFPLAQFAGLARLPGVNLISLQKGAGTEQLAALGGQFPVLDLSDRLDEAAGPFRDTAAIMKNLDLVISTDSAVPHLAGALGVPVWVPLRSAADWRWLLNRDDSPWYPTLRLFRQIRAGDWNEVFERMADALRTWPKS